MEESPAEEKSIGYPMCMSASMMQQEIHLLQWQLREQEKSKARAVADLMQHEKDALAQQINAQRDDALFWKAAFQKIASCIGLPVGPRITVTADMVDRCPRL